MNKKTLKTDLLLQQYHVSWGLIRRRKTHYAPLFVEMYLF